MKSDWASLLDALIFAKQILNFTEDMDQEEFEADLKTQAAILYEISILGEAYRRLSDEFREAYPQIPYRKIIAMRNRLVHDYDGINLGLVWSVVQQDIPELIDLMESLLPDELG